MKGRMLVACFAAFWTANAEKLAVYPPATTVEEKIALAERTLEYVAKSVSAEQIKPLADELAIDKEWCAKAKSPGEKYAAERAVMSVRRRILFMHPDLQFANLLAVQRGLPFSEEAGMTDQYAGRWSRPGPGLVAIENWKTVPHKKMLLAGKLPEGCTINPCLHWNADRVIFAFNDHEKKPPADPRKVHAPGVMCLGSKGETRPPVVKEVRDSDPTNPNLNPTAEADEFSAMHHRYFIYEAAVDGSWVRQLTGGPDDPMTTPDNLCTVLIEDADPCYLPGGGFVFTSTRAQNYGRCHWGRYVPSFLLYRADLPPDGAMRTGAANIHQFSFAEANEWRPSILGDGRIVYTRWDYVDRVASRYAGLWVTRQDGTAVDIIYGNYCTTMRSCAAAHQVPGTRFIVGVAGAHHMFSTGTLVLVDPLAGQDGEEPLTRLTPDTGILEAEGWFQKGSYMDPMPVNDTLYFASYSPDSFGYPKGHPHDDKVAIRSHWQHPRSYGVWLVDRLGGRELIYQDPEWSTFNPTPIVRRKRPPVLASTLPPPEKAPNYGTLYLQNIYDCRYPIPSNSVAAIRVNRMINMNACRRESWMPAADYAYYRETLGTVPVGKDGSAYFKIPAETPIQLQAIDTNGMAVMTMRSEIYAQKGEIQGCAGCHENKMTAAPVVKRPQGREPDVPAKEVDLGYPGPISYVRSIQPIFDRHCISCHGLGAYKGPKKPYSLIGTNGVLNLLYENWEFTNGILGKRSIRSGKKMQIATHWCYGETVESRPYDCYAAASPLFGRIRRGHGGARLSETEMKTLILWLDSNVPSYSIGGGYGWNRPELNTIDPEGEKALRAAIAERWGLARASEPIEALVNRADPAKSRVLLAALPESSGGWGQWEKPFTGKDDPQYAKFLALAKGTVVPSRWHDIRGTCGRDDKCECNSCWLRLGGFNDPKILHGKSECRRFLYSDFMNHKLVYVDEGNPAAYWEAFVPEIAFDISRAGLHRLYVSQKNGWREYTLAQLEFVREVKDDAIVKYGTGVCEGPNGNVFVLEQRGVVHEFTRDGKHVFTYTFPSSVRHGRALRFTDRGTALLGIDDGVAEVKLDKDVPPEARIVRLFTIPNAKSAYQGMYLKDGTLLATGGYLPELVRFAPDGTIKSRTKAGQKEGLADFFYGGFDLRRNGNILLANWTGHNGRDFIPGWKLIEFDPAGRVVWHWNAPWAGTPCAVISFD